MEGLQKSRCCTSNIKWEAHIKLIHLSWHLTYLCHSLSVQSNDYCSQDLLLEGILKNRFFQMDEKSVAVETEKLFYWHQKKREYGDRIRRIFGISPKGWEESALWSHEYIASKRQDKASFQQNKLSSNEYLVALFWKKMKVGSIDVMRVIGLWVYETQYGYFYPFQGNLSTNRMLMDQPPPHVFSFFYYYRCGIQLHLARLFQSCRAKRLNMTCSRSPSWSY